MVLPSKFYRKTILLSYTQMMSKKNKTLIFNTRMKDEALIKEQIGTICSGVNQMT